MPKYYQIYNKAMFDNNITDENPQIYLDGILQTPDYENLDLVEEAAEENLEVSEN